MKGWSWLFTVAQCSAIVTPAQNVVPADPCDRMPRDADAAGHFFTFDQFDRELRTAIVREGAVALAFLVKFPGRVNDAAGSISINDAAALKTQFQTVFTSEVRKQIMGETLDNTGVTTKGCRVPERSGSTPPSAARRLAVGTQLLALDHQPAARALTRDDRP